MLGTEHLFDVVEGGKTVQYRLITGINFYGAAIDLYKDGNPIIQSLKRGELGFWIIVVYGLVIYDGIY